MNEWRSQLKNKRILIVGLGRSGKAAARLASACGARVLITDIRPRQDLEENLATLGREVEVCLGKPDKVIREEPDLIVLSPGVPPQQNWIQSMAESGEEIIGEVEFAYQLLEGRVIGISGTNGKTTTTLLTGALLASSGIDVEVTGNIGTALSDSVFRARTQDRQPVYVTELSSFQLEGIKHFRCDTAALLNCTPDHLDRYPDYESYRDAKLKIFLNQQHSDFAVVNANDQNLMEGASHFKANIFPFSSEQELEEGVFLKNDTIWARKNGVSTRLTGIEEIRLRGRHNLENVMASLAIAFLEIGEGADFSRTISEFSGVEHRLEPVATIDGVDYINDSKSTTVESTLRALESFPGTIILIMGGSDKGSEFTPLKPMVKKKVRKLILLGQTAAKIKEDLSSQVPALIVPSMEEAVKAARQSAFRGDTVLLSPGCASFDMFKNFEERGDRFKSLVDLTKKTVAREKSEKEIEA